MLDKLFKPQSVALIGASDRPGSFGCDAAKSLIKSQEKLRFYFINQRKSEIFGIRTYPLLAELPEVPELVLIATPASTVNGLIRDAAQRGVHDFIVYSSGFAEDHRCNGEQMSGSWKRLPESTGCASSDQTAAEYSTTRTDYPFGAVRETISSVANAARRFSAIPEDIPWAAWIVRGWVSRMVSLAATAASSHRRNWRNIA